MNTQIYMLCFKDPGGAWNNDASKTMKAALTAKKILRAITNLDFILGDSLDVPFVKFIRVQGVEHGISFPGTSTHRAFADGEWQEKVTGSKAGDYEDASNPSWFGVGEEAWHHDTYTQWNKDFDRYEEDKGTIIGATKYANKRMHRRRAGQVFGFRRNKFTDITKPDHDDITITKLVDNATPQFAYAASAQEPFWYTFLYFRRKIGGGIPKTGVRMPFLMIGLYKSLITSWSLGGDMAETIKMNYSSIAWASIPPWADTNIPLAGVPAMRWWTTDDNKGGNKGGWALILAALTGALTAAAGGLALACSDDEGGF